MVTVRVPEAADVGVLAAAFPERGAAPVNRHVARFALQEAGDITCLVAWDGEIPIGYVFVRWPERRGGLTEQARALGYAEIGDLFVAEHARRRGTGRALLQAAEALCVVRGCLAVGLEVTARNPYNEAARNLYATMGYRESGLGEVISGYTFWDAGGNEQRDEEPYVYLTKLLQR